MLTSASAFNILYCLGSGSDLYRYHIYQINENQCELSFRVNEICTDHWFEGEMALFRQFFLSDTRYLTGVAIVLNIATSGPAFVVVEVPVGEGDSGEVLPAGAEPASARGVGSLPAAGSTHVVDDGVHIDVDLMSRYRIFNGDTTNQHLPSIASHFHSLSSHIKFILGSQDYVRAALPTIGFHCKVGDLVTQTYNSTKEGSSHSKML